MIVQFRNILIHHLHEEFLVDVRKLWQDIGCLLMKGTIVDFIGQKSKAIVRF